MQADNLNMLPIKPLQERVARLRDQVAASVYDGYTMIVHYERKSNSGNEWPGPVQRLSRDSRVQSVRGQ